MGSADIIPGVSGGTIALITGIYEEFINAIKTVNLLFIVYFFRGFTKRVYFKKAKENFFGIKFGFLIPLVVGIGIAFLVLANVIGWLLESYPSYTYAFFFGLILASAGVLFYQSLNRLSVTLVIFTIFGIITGVLIVGLDVLQTNHSLSVIFFAGVITICAMILPGISGAFILLVLGQYDFMLDVLRGLIHFDSSRAPFAIIYILGGLLGLILFSRVLSFLIKRYRVATLSFLIGLMLGALRKPTEIIVAQPENFIVIVIAGVFGVALVLLLSLVRNRFETPTDSTGVFK